ncbi:hypothetical protein LXL04_023146 [Taraxacum kok-saghyz]
MFVAPTTTSSASAATSSRSTTPDPTFPAPTHSMTTRLKQRFTKPFMLRKSLRSAFREPPLIIFPFSFGHLLIVKLKSEGNNISGQQVRLGHSVGPTLRWASSTLLFEGKSVWEAKAHGKRKHPYFHNLLWSAFEFGQLMVRKRLHIWTTVYKEIPEELNSVMDFRFFHLDINRDSSISMLELTSALVFSCPPTNSFSNKLLQPLMRSDLSFCSPPVGRQTDVIESQQRMLKSSMLSVQLKTSMLLHSYIYKLLRDVRLLPQSSSSFSPNLTNFEHHSTSNFLKFKRTLLACASDSHKCLDLQLFEDALQHLPTPDH